MKGGYIILQLDKHINVEQNQDGSYSYGDAYVEYGGRLYDIIHEALNSGKPILLTGVTVTANGLGDNMPFTGYLLTANKGDDAFAITSASFINSGFNFVISIILQHYTTSEYDELLQGYRLAVTITATQLT